MNIVIADTLTDALPEEARLIGAHEKLSILNAQARPSRNKP